MFLKSVMSNKKKYEGEKEMAESRKMKTEKGLALVPGANPLADGCNFAVEVPEDSRASLILYKKRSAKPYGTLWCRGGYESAQSQGRIS